MKAPDDLESLLRSLTPNTLPEDLKARLAVEPSPAPSPREPAHRRMMIAGFSLAAAAALVLVVREHGAPPSSPARPTVTVLHRDSSLVATRKLGFVEKDGRVFRVEERHWRDEEEALCSSSPVSVRLHEDRREIIYQPVRFD